MHRCADSSMSMKLSACYPCLTPPGELWPRGPSFTAAVFWGAPAADPGASWLTSSPVTSGAGRAG